jgi:pimeloyl-ACP methyl ester carboxylesterase
MPKVSVGEVELYYETQGEGEPLLLLQGMGNAIAGWASMPKVLGRTFTVTAYDHRGIGGSDKPVPPDHYTITQMADDAAGLIDALGLESTNIYGVSMGGAVAQQLVLRHPEKVRRVVLGCTSSTFNGEHFVPGTGAAMDPDAMLEPKPPATEESALAGARGLYSDAFVDKNREALTAYRGAGEFNLEQQKIIREHWLALHQHNVYDQLKTIDKPVLVIAGEEDPVIPVENSRRMAAQIPGAKLVILPDLRHAFYLESREATGIIVDFLKGES